jgi:hypothetical protein
MMSPGPNSTTIPSRAPASAPADGGPFSPRFALLAAMFYNPLILVGYTLYAYGPTTCVAGPLCRFDTFPGLFQVLLIAAGCALLWLLLFVAVERALEAPHARQTRYERLLSDMSDYPALRPLLAGYGSALLFVLFVAVYTRHASAPAVVVGAFTAIVCLYGALSGRRPRALPPPRAHTRARSAPLSAAGQVGQVASWPFTPPAEAPITETRTLPDIPPPTEAQP